MPTALIVGASRGLGRGLATEHHRRGWQVVGTVRDDAATIGAGIMTLRLDVTDRQAIDQLPRQLPRRVDRLFVVAGIAGPMDTIGNVAAQDFSTTMLTNVLGPLWVVERLAAGPLTEHATIAVMSSVQGSIANNDTGDQQTYRMSKAALNMGLRSVAARRADAHTYLAVNPGYVRTDMTGDAAELSVEDSVTRVVDVLDARTGSGGITFVDNDNRVLPW